MKYLRLIVLCAFACCSCGCGGGHETLGEYFESIADKHDATADHWQKQLDEGYAPFENSLRYELATAMVSENRRTANKMRGLLNPKIPTLQTKEPLAEHIKWKLASGQNPNPPPPPPPDDGLHSILKSPSLPTSDPSDPDEQGSFEERDGKLYLVPSSAAQRRNWQLVQPEPGKP